MKKNRCSLLVISAACCISFYFSSQGFAASFGIVFPSSSKGNLEHRDLLNTCISRTSQPASKITELRSISNIFILEESGANAAAQIQACLGKSGVIYPELTYRLEQIEQDRQLNDPEISSEWHLHNPKGVDVEALKGWAYLLSNNGSLSPGSPSGDVLVGVIDTGIASRHQDLANVIYKNSKEVAGNGVDDDQNGYVDDVYGWNFVENSPSPEDDNGHGTHVSGIIAAEQGNGFGIAGIYRQAKIVPIKAFDPSGEASTTSLVKSLDYAIGMNVRIINVSWGQYEQDPLLEAAIKKVAEQNILIVAAAGNDGTNTDQKPHFPSAYPFSEVLAVGALEKNGSPAGFSNFGAESVDVFAPGSNIYSTYLNNQFASKSGTSMAAPVVAGIAAAILGFEPNLLPFKLKARILDSARLPERRFPGLKGKCETEGVPSLVAGLGGLSGEKYDNIAPTTPEGIQTVSDGHFEAVLSWSPSMDNIAVDHYLVSRDQGPYVEASCCTFSDRTTEGGKTYAYSLVAVDWTGNKSIPAQAEITTPAFGTPNAWSAFAVKIESPHPYPSSATLSFEAKVPEGFTADKIRIHFSDFNTEEWFDKVTLYDQNGNKIATYMGELGAFVSADVAGDTIKIVLTTDKRNNRFGFAIDRIEAFLR